MTILNGLADAQGVAELAGLTVKTVQFQHYQAKAKADSGQALTGRDMPLPVGRFGRASVWDEQAVRDWVVARRPLDPEA